MNAQSKAQADALFGELGMNLSTAFNIFVRQSLREGGIPFDISLNQPNKPTTQFKKDYKLARKRGLKINLLQYNKSALAGLSAGVV